MEKLAWRTAWQGQDIVIYRNDVEVDRLPASQIERVVLIHRGSGNSPGELARVLIETDTDWLLFAAATGISGRINFERQPYWTERACTYWVGEARAPLPLRLRRTSWFLPFGMPAFRRVPLSQLGGVVERWPLQGPQTWEQRKWRRIQDKRPFSPAAEDRLRA